MWWIANTDTYADTNSDANSDANSDSYADTNSDANWRLRAVCNAVLSDDPAKDKHDLHGNRHSIGRIQRNSYFHRQRITWQYDCEL